MIRTLCVLIGALMSLVTACYAGEIKTDYDPAADFSHYKTYKMINGARDIAVAGRLTNTQVAGAVEDLLRAQFMTKGIQEEEVGGTPDLVVRYWAGVQQKTEVTDVNDWGGYAPFWDGGWWGPMWNDVMVTNYKKGTLLLDLIDSATKKLVWRAYLVATLSEDPDKAMEQADKDMTKAFQAFPPKK